MMQKKWVTEAANGYGQTIEVTRELCTFLYYSPQFQLQQ